MFNFVFDPYQQYRKSTLLPAFFGSDQRYMNPGLAKNYKFDAVIIGTSMTELFDTNYVNKTLNMNFMKLSISGATMYEQKLILNLALDHQNLKSVIWGIDIFSLKGKVESYRNGKKYFPHHLYDDNLLNDYKYLFNKDTFFEVVKIFRKFYINKDLDKFNINNMFIYKAKTGKINVLKKFNNGLLNTNFISSEYKFEVLKNNFDNNVLSIIKNHPNVVFNLYLPPYSILAWITINNNGWLEDAYKIKNYIFKTLRSYPNVNFFNFQEDKEIIMNFDNYIDSTHYSSDVNKVIVDFIQSKKVIGINEKDQDNMLRNIELFNKTLIRRE
jgi:hypothetical protein